MVYNAVECCNTLAADDENQKLCRTQGFCCFFINCRSITTLDSVVYHYSNYELQYQVINLYIRTIFAEIVNFAQMYVGDRGCQQVRLLSHCLHGRTFPVSRTVCGTFLGALWRAMRNLLHLTRQLKMILLEYHRYFRFRREGICLIRNR